MPLPLIIIPVFNALEVLEGCLKSVARTVPFDTRVLLINDASTDKRVQPLLQSWVDEAKPYRSLLVHDENRGFVATANHGMQSANTHVVLLNSDTEVTSGWLEHLADCLDSDDTIATATPWSNNGEIVSIPNFCAPNPVPTIIAVGVANPNAHGQAITSTDTALTNPIVRFPLIVHIANVITAIPTTLGTKKAETLSARD